MKKKFLNYLFVFSNILFKAQDEIDTRCYNTDNGLPQNSVKDIAKDKYGFIWVSTENGVVRFDGTTFNIFNNFPINSQRFKTFYGDVQRDSIFINEAYNEKKLLINKRKVNIDNHNLVGTIYKDKVLFHHFIQKDLTGNLRVNDGIFFKFGRGTYYICKNFLIYESSSYRIKKYFDTKISNVLNFFTSGNSLFYIDYDKGKFTEIVEGKITKEIQLSIIKGKNVKVFWSQINKQTFIIRDNTIFFLTYKNKSFALKRIYTYNTEIIPNISSIYYDEFNFKLFLGSTTKGLFIITLPFFYTNKITNENKKYDNVFYSSLPFGKSSVITPDGRVYGKHGIIKSFNFKVSEKYFMIYDAEKNIILIEGGRLNRYNWRKSYQQFGSYKISKSQIYSLFIQKKKYFVCIKKNDFLSILNVYTDSDFKFLQNKFSFETEVLCIHSLNDNNIFVGCRNGLYKVSLNTGFKKRLTQNQNLQIRNIVETKDGNIWVFTLGKGFYLLKNEGLVQMPYDKDKSLMTPHTLLEDNSGFFWISTNNGLFKVRSRQLTEYAANRNTSVFYYKFSKERGFNTNEFNGGGSPCGNILDNGEFVLPSLDGFVFFEPSKIKSIYPTGIYAEKAIIDNTEFFFDKTINLKQDFHRLDINIDIPYYGNSENLLIQAKFTRPNENYSSKWETLNNNEKKYSLTNLEYGEYNLFIRTLSESNGSFFYKKIKIIIPPYFYQTFWFKIMVIFFVTTILYGGIKWRIEYLKRKNRKLKKIIANKTNDLSETVKKLELAHQQLIRETIQQKKLIGTITHDITTPVKFIALTAEGAFKSKNLNDEFLRKALTSLYKSSSQLYYFTKTLKEYAYIYDNNKAYEEEAYLIYNLLEEKKVLFQEIAQGNNSTITINDFDKDLKTFVSKNILSAIIHNLLDNSIKNTSNGQIIFNCAKGDDYVILEISDTGEGMNEKQIAYYMWIQDNIEDDKLVLQKYGLGLHLVIQLLQIIESKLIIRRNIPNGTLFQLKLKNK